MGRRKNRKPRYTPEEITAAFDEAEEEFGDHKSTTFLASIVSDRLGIEYMDVIEGIIALCDEVPTASEGDGASL